MEHFVASTKRGKASGNRGTYTIGECDPGMFFGVERRSGREIKIVGYLLSRKAIDTARFINPNGTAGPVRTGDLLIHNQAL